MVTGPAFLKLKLVIRVHEVALYPSWKVFYAEYIQRNGILPRASHHIQKNF